MLDCFEIRIPFGPLHPQTSRTWTPQVNSKPFQHSESSWINLTIYLFYLILHFGLVSFICSVLYAPRESFSHLISTSCATFAFLVVLGTFRTLSLWTVCTNTFWIVTATYWYRENICISMTWSWSCKSFPCHIHLTCTSHDLAAEPQLCSCLSLVPLAILQANKGRKRRNSCGC